MNKALHVEEEKNRSVLDRCLVSGAPNSVTTSTSSHGSQIHTPTRDKIFEYTDGLPSLPSIRNSIPLCQKVDSRYTPGKYGKSTNGILRYTNRMFSIRLVYFRILHGRYRKSTNGILRHTNRMFSIRLVYFKIL